jgi:hypothetical protein
MVLRKPAYFCSPNVIANCRGQTFRKTKNILERRTKIIIALVVTLVVGLPLLFMFELSSGFGSSAGDYYKISDLYVTLISQNSKPDSSDYKLFTKINKVDTSRQIGLCIFLNTDFYSHKMNSSSTLMAAQQPGTFGCKEKIQSVSCIITDKKTNTENEIVTLTYMPDDMPTFSNDPGNSFFKNSKVCIYGERWGDAVLFKNLEDFKTKFNSNSADLSNCGIREVPILFYLKKQSFNNIDSAFKMTLKFLMSDGSSISASTSASIK